MRLPKDRPIIIGDNIEALRLIVEHGLVDALNPKFGFPKAHTCVELADHYALFSHFAGYARESDNGYSALLLPKSTFTLEDAAFFFEETIRETSGGVRLQIEVTVPPLSAN